MPPPLHTTPCHTSLFLLVSGASRALPIPSRMVLVFLLVFFFFCFVGVPFFICVGTKRSKEETPLLLMISLAMHGEEERRVRHTNRTQRTAMGRGLLPLPLLRFFFGKRLLLGRTPPFPVRLDLASVFAVFASTTAALSGAEWWRSSVSFFTMKIFSWGSTVFALSSPVEIISLRHRRINDGRRMWHTSARGRKVAVEGELLIERLRLWGDAKERILGVRRAADPPQCHAKE